jgi:carboxypeptidase T
MSAFRLLSRMLRRPLSGAAALFPIVLAAQAPTHARVRVHLEDLPGGVAGLIELGIAADHGSLREGTSLTTDLSMNEIARLQEAGVAHEVLIPDVAAYYAARAWEPAPSGLRGGGTTCNPQPYFPVPQHVTEGSMGGFYTWDEMVAILDEMHEAYPQLISSKVSIGESWEGRPLYMVRISDQPDVDQDEPEVLYDALHHAREPASLSQLIFYMWYLLENYGTNDEVTYLVDSTEMYFVPCVNPDGYVYNWNNHPTGGGMWRKNRRVNGNGTFGVDLNRNYGHEWGYNNTGSSPDPGSEVYRGPAAFSEPEIQAMRDFCESRSFRIALNYHTFGDLLVYPWGFMPSHYTPDSAVFANYGRLLTRDNHYVYGTADQTVNYTTNGSSDDWMYGEQGTKPKILSMTPEAGLASDGFWPQAWRIPDICQVNMGQNLLMAHLAGRYAEAVDRSGPVVWGVETHIPFDLTRYGLEPGTFTVSITPLTAGVLAGPPVVFEGMDLLETRTDSITITLPTGLQNGDPVSLVLSVGNGAYTHHDTLTKFFGLPVIAFHDAMDNTSAWASSAWGTTTATYWSPPRSMTDSPNGNYPNNTLNTLALASPIDLSDATSATLTFRARWDIEPRYDQVQVSASADGVAWTPLCGRYTRPGSADQSQGEPVFDGRMPEWVEESMDLNAFIGGPVYLRFRLTSDPAVQRDGFYFDDLQVITTVAPSTAVEGIHADRPVLQCHPNPASTDARIHYMAAPGRPAELLLHDALGAVVQRVPLPATGGSATLSLDSHAPGLYTATLLSADEPVARQRLVIVRP